MRGTTSRRAVLAGMAAATASGAAGNAAGADPDAELRRLYRAFLEADDRSRGEAADGSPEAVAAADAALRRFLDHPAETVGGVLLKLRLAHEPEEWAELRAYAALPPQQQQEHPDFYTFDHLPPVAALRDLERLAGEAGA